MRGAKHVSDRFPEPGAIVVAHDPRGWEGWFRWTGEVWMVHTLFGWLVFRGWPLWWRPLTAKERRKWQPNDPPVTY